MGFLKRDMNLKLIFMILILIIAITGFSIFYKFKLENVSIEYENKSKQLEEITAKAISEEAKIQEISQSKETLSNDKAVLEEGYSSLNNENQELKKEKTILEEEIASVKLELGKTKSELKEKVNNFNLLQARFDQIEGSLVKANDEVSSLAAKVNDLCKELEAAGGNDDEC
jgi:chromosome segregation ATPase